MKQQSGHTYLRKLHKEWVAYDLISQFFIAIAVAVLSLTILSRFIPVSFWWLIPITIVITLITVLWTGILKKSVQDIAGLLDRSFPQLEESTWLLLKPGNSLNLLEKLQVTKIERELPGIPAKTLSSGRFTVARNLLLAALILAFGVGQLEPFGYNEIKTGNIKSSLKLSPAPDKILPGIRSVGLTITPPAYTRRAPRRQNQFSVSAEEGSNLSWVIRTSQPVRNISFIFNDNERISLRPVNKDKTRWAIAKKLTASCFYQVDLDGTLSDLYKLEIIKDQPAVVRILSPGQYSSIDFGEPQMTSLQVQINDDYGINDAFISATISSGKGEGVKFKDQKLTFRQTFSGAAHYKLNKTIDLKGLDMVPGDELYFYIQARDSRLQDSRSDIYIVTIQDTAQLMSMEGLMGGINLVPEYFRSQRQIIIDTEKLIKEKNTISSGDFNNRSNGIATDQKLLRLRYGKFLGEEDESEIGGHQEDEGHDEPADFGNAQKLLDAVAHKHDQAEDATFFEPVQKAQLKATLNEMWKAELLLRLYKPVEALPFDYKALRLLKDLQQQSRVYVAKTSFKPPVIPADKRLSGELDKVIQPQAQRTAAIKADLQNSLRLTPGIISSAKAGRKLNPSEILTLNDVGRILTSRAAQEPAFYLNPLAILRAVIRQGSLSGISASKINELEAALQKIVKQASPVPQREAGGPASDLSAEYFNNLKRNR